LLAVLFVSTSLHQDLSVLRVALEVAGVVDEEAEEDSVTVADVEADEVAVGALVIVVDVVALEVVAEAAPTVVASETSRARSRLFKSRHGENCVPVNTPHTTLWVEC